MNKADATLLHEHFAGMGLRSAATEAEADVVHILTCCVRQKAEDKFFSYLGTLARMKARRPGMVVGVGGCIPALRDVRESAAAVDYTMPSGDPEAYIASLRDALDERGIAIAPAALSAGHGVSEFCTVMRGCTNHCSYCVVPRVRGPERSRDPVDVRKEVDARANAGVKEIILLGQNVLAYGADFQTKKTLADLLRVVHTIDGILRIRFVTSHPAWVTEDFLDAMTKLPKVCEHFHVPFQSGDDEILRRMNRKYTAEEYLRVVSNIRKYFPHAGITADAIVGFPGETEAQFENTLRLIRDAQVDSIFSFKYSVRPDTNAARHEDDVPVEEKKERLRRLNALQRGIALKRNQALVGNTQEVMVEETLGKDVVKYRGRTRANKVAEFAAGRELGIGDVVRVKVLRATAYALQGELEGA